MAVILDALDLTLAARLHAAIVAGGVPITSVSVSRTKATASVVPTNLQAQAQPIIDAFDDSLAAAEAYLENQEPLLQMLRDQATQALADIDGYLASADTATAVQVRAEVKAIDQRQKKIIQALKRIVQRTWRS